jgi:hypothetical protein
MDTFITILPRPIFMKNFHLDIACSMAMFKMLITPDQEMKSAYVVTRKMPFAHNQGMLEDIWATEELYASPTRMCTSCRREGSIRPKTSSTFAHPRWSRTGDREQDRCRVSMVNFWTMCSPVIPDSKEPSHGS